ncbi:hypothetical protein CHS0354_005012 [Potamilus streckersoni]|uniref:Uncharacterized protein n=1 Tax=Potamilus streckersoni TaxID=2493646 RepID=A0AAE0W099_9BIVA|nr:hypothetical protein CHS0354_005012 [Potamilus streckersoni]
MLHHKIIIGMNNPRSLPNAVWWRNNFVGVIGRDEHQEVSRRWDGEGLKPEGNLKMLMTTTVWQIKFCLGDADDYLSMTDKVIHYDADDYLSMTDQVLH